MVCSKEGAGEGLLLLSTTGGSGSIVRLRHRQLYGSLILLVPSGGYLENCSAAA